jgi:hypothetical protein
VTTKEVAKVAGRVVVCGKGQRPTVAALARIRRAPHHSSPPESAALVASRRTVRWPG